MAQSLNFNFRLCVCAQNCQDTRLNTQQQQQQQQQKQRQQQQPTTNDQTTNNQRPNNQQPTTKQPSNNNKQQTTNNKQQTTNNKQQTTNHQQPATNANHHTRLEVRKSTKSHHQIRPSDSVPQQNTPSKDWSVIVALKRRWIAWVASPKWQVAGWWIAALPLALTMRLGWWYLVFLRHSSWVGGVIFLNRNVWLHSLVCHSLDRYTGLVWWKLRY